MCDMIIISIDRHQIAEVEVRRTLETEYGMEPGQYEFEISAVNHLPEDTDMLEIKVWERSC